MNCNLRKFTRNLCLWSKCVCIDFWFFLELDCNVIKPPWTHLSVMHLNMRRDGTVLCTLYCTYDPYKFIVYVTSGQKKTLCDEALCVCEMSPNMSLVNGTHIYSTVFGSWGGHLVKNDNSFGGDIRPAIGLTVPRDLSCWRLRHMWLLLLL